jgi:pimeloyl-ACP methyl ester carboxylesterase
MSNYIHSAENWFSKGERISYNPEKKKILKPNENKEDESLNVFHQIVNRNSNTANNYCITLLPGFPDGSFGWRQVEQLLAKENDSQRLYVEYVGQGDSDKPDDYPYNTMERADLVEAMWEYYKIERTFVVTFDYSSLATLELLRRQKERHGSSTTNKKRISRVLMINGGLFADAHSHPYLTTPLLKTSFGKMGTRIAQKSHFAFNLMLKSMWSKEYGVTNAELNELFAAITRRNGATFISNAAGFVDEHKRNSKRWDLLNIYGEMKDEVSFHIVGSEKDQFEPIQVVKAKERLGKYNVDIRLVPGGHMTTSEYPDILANIIQKLDELKIKTHNNIKKAIHN